jgi:hypothetical protein
MSFLAIKTPEETKDYSLDWSQDLQGDTINTSAWSVSPADVTVPQSTIGTGTAPGNTLTTVWLTGGTIGRGYDVTNTINTVGGRELTKAFRLYLTGRNYL